MSRRPIKALSHPIEPLEHRLLMSASTNNDSEMVECACPICKGATSQHAPLDQRMIARESRMNPVGIHRGAPQTANEPGNVSGFVWLDGNTNGELDLTEAGLFNQTVFLDENDNGVLDNGERSTVTNPNGYYVFKDVDPGDYTIRQLRWEELSVSEPSNDRHSISLQEDEVIQDQNFGNFLVDPIVIDYLVVYTPAARRGAGGADEINAEIRDMIAASNSAFANSQINIKLNLVAARRIAYNEKIDLEGDRNRLRLKNEGFMRDIHNLRDELGADMVTLLAQEGLEGEGGIAFFPNRDVQDPSTFGFNVVSRYFGAYFMVFTHELGHNLGAGHDIETDPGGAFPFSKGWHFEVNGNLYRTVMAYPIDRDFTAEGTEEVLPIFSNPDLTYKGVALGQEREGDNRGADNARTIRRFAALVANYRDRDQAGETRSTALNLGNFNAGRTGVVRDSVGDADAYDVFKIRVTDPIQFTSRLFRLSRNAELQLLQGKRVIDSSRKLGNKAERIERVLEPGNYFVRVYHGGGQIGTNYTLKLIGDELEEAPSASSIRAIAAKAASTSLFAKRDSDDSSEDDETALVDLV